MATTARSPRAVLIRRLLLPLVVIVGLVIVWDLAIRVFAVPPYVVPTPASVGQALVKERARLLDNAIPTIVESLGGFALGNLVAIAAALAFVHSKVLERALYPVAVAVRTLPIVAIAPILVLLLGNGYAPKVAIAALITFFPTLVNMVEGLESAWDLQLILRGPEVPKLNLDGSSRLGWTTWLYSKPPQNDADDLVLQPRINRVPRFNHEQTIEEAVAA